MHRFVNTEIILLTENDVISKLHPWALHNNLNADSERACPILYPFYIDTPLFNHGVRSYFSTNCDEILHTRRSCNWDWFGQVWCCSVTGLKSREKSHSSVLPLPEMLSLTLHRATYYFVVVSATILSYSVDVTLKQLVSSHCNTSQSDNKSLSVFFCGREPWDLFFRGSWYSRRLVGINFTTK